MYVLMDGVQVPVVASETEGRMGSLVLAWDAVQAGAADASDGRNVVFHEFAHQLDFEDYSSDGVPLLSSRDQERSWGSVMRVEFASLRAADATGIPTLLDTYGATNPAEFSLRAQGIAASSDTSWDTVKQEVT